MSRRHLATQSIDGVDDATIKAALDQLSVSALIASVVQITGDPTFIREPIRPVTFVQNEFQGMLDEESKATLRGAAQQAISEGAEIIVGPLNDAPPRAEAKSRYDEWTRLPNEDPEADAKLARQIKICRNC